jgi:para-nitrobenzyl esterase
MGPLRLTHQDEDCLSLNIWTPGPGGPARPVLVWIHGGGFSSGTGGADWYDGARLAERGDLIVVTINYRLAALGFAYLDGIAPANLGLLDMTAALRWVRDNIAAFGGDPRQVTVAGQSGGALSIVSLLPTGLFHRAILQSGPYALRPLSTEQADRNTGLLLRELGLDGPPAAARSTLREVGVERLLAAQLTVARTAAAAQRNPLNVSPPFQLVADGITVAADPIGAAGAVAGQTDLLIGWTRDELAAFIGGDPRFGAITAAEVVEAVRDWYGDTAEERYAACQAEQPGTTPAETAVALSTDHMFRRDAVRLAAASPKTRTYQFDWRPQGSPFGACHCLELPFVFGNPDAWQTAPMLPNGVTPQTLVDTVQSAWIEFTAGQPTTWPDGLRHLDID